MAKFFSYFPQTFYTLDDNPNALDVITNINFRFVFDAAFKSNTAAYYEYIIQDGDTPEILAYKLYGSSERHWIILLYNDIIDPLFDWPLQQSVLNNFIENKYGSISWSQSNVKNYQKVTTRTDNYSGTVQTDIVNVDANTYANVIISTNSYTLGDGNSITVDISKQTQSYYDYEVDLNDSKKTIKILKEEFVLPAEQEFKNIINNLR
jgi:hypothetical protein